MKYSDEDCINFLERKDDLNSYCLIDIFDGAYNFSIKVIRSGLLFNCLIEDDDLMFACIDFLARNGNSVYKDIKEFKEKNPDIIC